MITCRLAVRKQVGKDTERNLKTSRDENTTFCSDQCSKDDS